MSSFFHVWLGNKKGIRFKNLKLLLFLYWADMFLKGCGFFVWLVCLFNQPSIGVAPDKGKFENI